jgi:hypothetical protein
MHRSQKMQYREVETFCENLPCRKTRPGSIFPCEKFPFFPLVESELLQDRTSCTLIPQSVDCIDDVARYDLKIPSFRMRK